MAIWRTRAITVSLAIHLGLLRSLGVEASDASRASLAAAIDQAFAVGIVSEDEFPVLLRVLSRANRARHLGLLEKVRPD